MEPKIIKIRIKRALSRSGLSDLDYALNPYAGCYHACIYCYAREFTKMRDVAKHWGSIIAVKTNIVDVLRREIEKTERGVVGIGTITDAYQPIEAEYGLTRRCIEALLNSGFHVSIQTKSYLVTRDLELLASRPSLVDVGFTITTLDNSVARFLEPRAPDPRERVAALERVASAGIETWVFLGPIVPGYNDDPSSIERVIEIAASTNSVLYYDKLRVKKFMLTDPRLAEIASKACNYPWRKLFKLIDQLCRKHGVRCIYSTAIPKKRKTVFTQRSLDSYAESRRE